MASRWLVVGASYLVATSCLGDGGTLRLSQSVGGYRIAVFTAPEPLRVGLVDVSVLLQDETSNQTILDATVVVGFRSREDIAQERKLPATRDASTNRLLYSCQTHLPQAGWWRITVDVQGPLGPAGAEITVPVSDPPPRWLSLWPWIVWPAFIILFVIVQQWVARRPTGGNSPSRNRP